MKVIKFIKSAMFLFLSETVHVSSPLADHKWSTNRE